MEYMNQFEKKKHIVLVSQPDDIFSTHITPKGRVAGPTCEAIMEFLETHNLVETLKVVGVDSTAVNTGANTGILKRMEDQIGRKVYWGVCDLYTNELGLRHLFQKIDGLTTGNNSFKGPIGKSLSKVKSLLRNENFEAITEGPETIGMPDAIAKDLSSDQKYLY